MREWILNLFGIAPQRVRVVVVATFTREPERGKVLCARLIEVWPAGLDMDLRVELLARFDDSEQWYPIAEVSAEDAEAFGNLLLDAVAYRQDRQRWVRED